MTVREYVSQSLQTLDDADLVQVADYLAYLRFRSRSHATPEVDAEKIAALYAEAAAEDRELAEAGIGGYAAALAKEDSQ